MLLDRGHLEIGIIWSFPQNYQLPRYPCFNLKIGVIWSYLLLQLVVLQFQLPDALHVVDEAVVEADQLIFLVHPAVEVHHLILERH